MDGKGVRSLAGVALRLLSGRFREDGNMSKKKTIKGKKPIKTKVEAPDIKGYATPTPPVTRRMTAECIAKVEAMVAKWLDESDESICEVELMDEENNLTGTIAFERVVINLKRCSNSWDQYHVAQGYALLLGAWPRLISSIQRKTFCNNTCSTIPYRPPNEVLSEHPSSGVSFVKEPELK
jgi:hypothetical protein